MLKFLKYGAQAKQVTAGFCTLAVHPPYRQRAKLLLSDAPGVPWIVLTDEPDDFLGLPVRVIRHVPTGPMATDFLKTISTTGNGRGAPAYHDKRFAIQAALREFDTAIFIDADSRLTALPTLPNFRAGIAVVKEVDSNIAEHLSRWGQHRTSAFEQLAIELTGDAENLKSARWCSEALFAVTKDGNENKFLDAWARGAEFLQRKGLFTGEGGVIGLAALYAGWTVDYKALKKLDAARRHEGGGPKIKEEG
jgi:hypothetical protein